eukprot:482691-Hanusia_phi.AAC.2
MCLVRATSPHFNEGHLRCGLPSDGQRRLGRWKEKPAFCCEHFCFNCFEAEHGLHSPPDREWTSTASSDFPWRTRGRGGEATGVSGRADMSSSQHHLGSNERRKVASRRCPPLILFHSNLDEDKILCLVNCKPNTRTKQQAVIEVDNIVAMNRPDAM